MLQRRALLQGLEAPVHFGQFLLEVQADGAEPLHGTFVVELFEQRTALGRVIGDLWGGGTLPAEATLVLVRDRVRNDESARVILEPVDDLLWLPDGGAICDSKSKEPASGDW